MPVLARLCSILGKQIKKVSEKIVIWAEHCGKSGDLHQIMLIIHSFLAETLLIYTFRGKNEEDGIIFHANNR